MPSPSACSYSLSLSCSLLSWLRFMASHTALDCPASPCGMQQLLRPSLTQIALRFGSCCSLPAVSLASLPLPPLPYPPPNTTPLPVSASSGGVASILPALPAWLMRHEAAKVSAPLSKQATTCNSWQCLPAPRPHPQLPSLAPPSRSSPQAQSAGLTWSIFV